MKIDNDKIIFDASDFDGLSDLAKKALPIFVGERTSVEKVFADSLNAQIQAAKDMLIAQTAETDTAKSIIEGFASADEKALAQAAPLLAQLQKILS